MLILHQRPLAYEEVAPKLIFASNQDVQLKTTFDEAYFSAQPYQVLLTGALIKTGDQSFAEIQLEENVVRLDQNTELKLLENNFQNPDLPRFVFELFSGSVWVNAFDPILIKTTQSQAHFAHTVGVYTYSDPLNRVMSIIGHVDLDLLDEEGVLLSQFIVPLKSQVTFVNSQIVPEYARLEYSKLKKELKMGPIFKTVLEEEWVKRNTRDDAIIFLAENNYIFSKTSYLLKNSYHALREKLSLSPNQKQVERLNQAKTKLKYLLGGVHERDLKDEAKKILNEFNELIEPFRGDPALQDLMERQFYAIKNVQVNTPAYAVKENLREHLLSKDSPEFLRTYLADLDFLMRVEEIEQAEKLVKVWIEHWKPDMREAHLNEFDQQARIFHRILLAYAVKVSPSLLAVLDEVGDSRLTVSEDAEETLFEIALERLEMSKYLVSVYRYPEARTYLKTSYAKLNLAEKEVSEAAREVFLKEASLIAERIAFAEQTLRGAAEPVEEEEFLEYLSVQERNRLLEERFITFLEEAEALEEIVYPTIQDVSQRFASARIVVLEEDISVNPDFPFEFEIKDARLVDRAEDGSLIAFSGYYNYSENALYNVLMNGMALKGNFALEDFVQIAKTGKVEVITEVEPKIDTLEELLGVTESEEAQRSQIIAQDLAIQLMIKELEEFSIFIPSAQNVTVLDPVTLNEFRVSNVVLEDFESGRRVNVNFDYNSVTKVISNVQFEEVIVVVPSQIQAEQFISVVFNALYGAEAETKAIRDTISELGRQNILAEEGDLIIGSDRNRVEFQNVRLKTMPIEFSGIYDRRAKIFLRAEHPLFTAENMTVSNYISALSERFVIDYLGSKGIGISKENITSSLPASKVSIKNYVRGDKVLDFTYDATGNRLIDIVLQGTDAKVDSMTFEEFSLIE